MLCRVNYGFFGRATSIGDMPVKYGFFGYMPVKYGFSGRIVQIGDMPVNYGIFGRATSIGDINIHYGIFFGRIVGISSSRASTPINGSLSHKQVAALVAIVIQWQNFIG